MRGYFAVFLVIALIILALPAHADWIVDKDGAVTRSQILGEETNKSEDQDKEKEKVEIKREEKKNENKATMEVQKGPVKLKIERDGDALKVKGQDENGQEFELETKKDEKIEMEDIEIASGSGTTIRIKDGETETETELPVAVDTVTKKLSVGGKPITVLPDAAIKNAFTNASATAKTKVEIKNRGEEMVYEIDREEKKKLFGLFELTFNKSSVVSADSGKVLENTQAWWSSLLESLSR